jgi:hypothetical protein
MRGNVEHLFIAGKIAALPAPLNPLLQAAFALIAAAPVIVMVAALARSITAPIAIARQVAQLTYQPAAGDTIHDLALFH